MASRKRPATDTALSNTKATKIARETGDLRWTDVFSHEPGKIKIAAMDLDWTIVGTKSKKNFPTDPSDWCWLYPSIPENLRQLSNDGFRLVIFTNQAGLEKKIATVDSVKKRIEQIQQNLHIPIQAFVATGENQYRKPATAMWEYFVSNCNDGIPVDMTFSFFVGDAAGRAKNWEMGRRKDFSASDRKFAANIGLNFYTPEEFFLKAKSAPFEWGGSFVPTKFLKDNSILDDRKDYHKEEQEMIILVGMPACGKSSFCKRKMIPHGYIHINRDALKTQIKCVQVAKDSLKEGKSVIIDNTNPSKSARKEFLKLAVAAKVNCRCFFFDTPPDLSHHLNYVRQNMTNGENRRVPDVAYRVFNKSFENPSLDEGFAEVITVPFIPVFDNPKAKELFQQWTG